MAWRGTGTKLPPGFAALRMRTNWLHCWSNERVQPNGSLIAEPARLLCRALWLAPACYRCFELRPAVPAQVLHLRATVCQHMDEHHQSPDQHRADGSFTFGDLAAAMKRCGGAEGVVVVPSPDPLCIVVRRASTETQAIAADVQ